MRAKIFAAVSNARCEVGGRWNCWGKLISIFIDKNNNGRERFHEKIFLRQKLTPLFASNFN